MAESGDEDDVWILWIDDDARNLASVLEADVCPCLAGVAGFVNSITGGEVGTDIRFTSGGINNFRIRG